MAATPAAALLTRVSTSRPSPAGTASHGFPGWRAALANAGAARPHTLRPSLPAHPTALLGCLHWRGHFILPLG